MSLFADFACSERYKKRILHAATRGKDWALNVTSSTSFMQLGYQRLLHELHNSLQQYKMQKTTVIYLKRRGLSVLVVFMKQILQDKVATCIQDNIRGRGRRRKYQEVLELRPVELFCKSTPTCKESKKDET